MSLYDLSRRKKNALKSSWIIGIPLFSTPRPYAKTLLIQEIRFNRIVNNAMHEILELKNGWDGFDAKSFEPKTFRKAKKFILELYNLLYQNVTSLPDPYISPSDDGSIDFHFRNEKIDLLLNIPEIENVVYVSSDDYQDMELEASIPIELAVKIISEWMLELLLK